MDKEKITTFTTPILVGLLVVAAFLAGMFWTKIRYLEQGKAPEKVGQASPSPMIPQEEGAVLSGEGVKRIKSGGAAVKGDENAPVTIVEFSEYQCPYCKKYVDETYSQIWDEYGDKIRYIFHDYPLSFHPHAQKLAEVARCAGDQNKYWEMHDLLFEKREEWAEKENIDSNIASYVTQLGLDKEEFNTCLSSGKYTQAVKDDFNLGTEVGVQGTPTFFINGQILVGAQPFENFKAIIDAELAK